MNKKTGEIRKFEAEEFDKFMDLGDWVDLSKIFYKGKILVIDNTKWEIKRVDIRLGKNGRVMLKLKGLPL